MKFDVNQFIRSLVILAGMAGVVAVTYLLGTTYLRSKAINECGQLGRVTFEVTSSTGEKTSSELPSNDTYKQCLTDKGITLE